MGHIDSMGLRLKSLLGERGMTQQALADAIGSPKGYISQLVHNKRQPSMATLDLIATALDVDIRALFEPSRSVEVSGEVIGATSVRMGADGSHVAPPADLPGRDVIAIGVGTDALLPLIEPGAVLFFTRTGREVDPKAPGHVALCQTEAGEALLAMLGKGRAEGLYDLHPLADGIPARYGERLAWAAQFRRHMLAEDVVRIPAVRAA